MHSHERVMLPYRQDPKAVALRKKFEDAMAEAEQLMIKRNSDPESRARHSPAGVPYRLMYPSVQTDPPTPENQGMTGCGIPYVLPLHQFLLLTVGCCMCYVQEMLQCSVHAHPGLACNPKFRPS